MYRCQAIDDLHWAGGDKEINRCVFASSNLFISTRTLSSMLDLMSLKRRNVKIILKLNLSEVSRDNRF